MSGDLPLQSSPNLSVPSVPSSSVPTHPSMATELAGNGRGTGTDPNTSNGKPSWWFTGGQAAHQDHFIDLFGDTTDHLPDVRQYLILIGPSSSTEKPFTRKRARLGHDEQDEALKRGIALLRKAWQEGQGYFLNPNHPGRDYTNQSQDQDTQKRGVAWYDDLRLTGFGFYGHPARVYVPDDIRPTWGDVGGNCVNQWGVGDGQHPFFSRGEHALTEDLLLKTNLRCPLPKWEYCLARPGDKEQWAKFVFALYRKTGHPAFKAIDSDVRYSSTDVDVNRNVGLQAKGFLSPRWVDDYPEAFENEDDFMDG